MTELRRKVRELLDRTAPGPWVVGCSLGPDSLALADCALAARPAEVILVYVDHGLRAEAAEEGRRVVALAEAHGARGRVVPIQVTRAGRGLEDAARQARHAALASLADEVGAPWILLAHTASDQAETVLGRLIRGAGVVGLAGIPARRGRILRPFLDVPRATLLAYLDGCGLTPALDPMNDDPAFLRARLRHDLLPRLRAENPRLDEALGRTARALRESADVLDWAVARAEADLGPGPRLLAGALATLPPALAKRLLARRAAALGAALEARHLDAALALASGSPAGETELHLPGLRLRREYGDLVLEAPGAPGAEAAPVSVEVRDGEPPDGPYLVRTWQPGDRMRPAALRGRSRKLQDLFTDRKVPARARRAAVLVVRQRDGEIVWAEHIGPACSARLQVALTRGDSPVI